MTIDQEKQGFPVARASSDSTRAVVGSRFNPAMLTTAREARYLTQSDLADALGVSQPLVGKWEAELSTPSDEQVSRLAEKLHVRAELFFVDRPRRLASMSDFYHRALSRAKRSDVRAIHARCSIYDLQIDRLMELGPLPKDLIPDLDPEDHAGDFERIAIEARKAMGIGPGPITNLTTAIEACGAIIVDRDLEVDEVDALCRWVPGLPKLFFVNGTRPADRYRFSLAHELGHTIMHFGRDLDPTEAEKQANAFASAFLMPASDIRRDFRTPLGLPDLAALKRKWRVSMQALARRAWTLKAINDVRYKSICVQMSRNGWRKAEPVNVDGETPASFRYLVRLHVEAGYTREDLAKMLFVSESHVDQLLADSVTPTWASHGVRLRLAR